MAQTHSNEQRTAIRRFMDWTPKIIQNKNTFASFLLVVFVMSILTGSCSIIPFSGKQQKLSYENLAAPYNQITLKENITLDVTPIMQRSEKELGPDLAGTELLSKSQNTVASSGQSKNGYMTWFNMVTFHQYRLNVIRKAFFVVNDKETSLGTHTTRSLRFDCQTVLPQEILTRQYLSDSARQIATLKLVFSAVRSDIDTLGAGTDTPGQGNQMLSACGLLINQTFEAILLKLESSPVLATRLSEPDGVLFDHISFDKGTIQMTIKADTATIHIRLGSLANTK